MTRNENQLFGRHFEMLQIFHLSYLFFILYWNMVVISVYMCGVKIIKKIPVEKLVFLRGYCTPGPYF